MCASFVALTSLLTDSRLFTKGARILEFEKLREIIGDFQQLNFARGAILLPLICAQAQDPDNTALEFWHSNPTPGTIDPRKDVVEQRLKTYDLILDSLTVFEERCKENNAAVEGLAATDEPEAVRDHAYELAFASEDEMFHSTLYDWLIERNLADDLLEVRETSFHGHHTCSTFPYRCDLNTSRLTCEEIHPRFRSISCFGNSTSRTASR